MQYRNLEVLNPVRRCIQLALLLAVVASASAFASELAILHNGFSIRHEWREQIGPVTRLYLTSGRASYVDVPTADVQRFEADLTPAHPKVETFASAPGTIPATPKLDTRKLDARELQELINATGDRHNIDPDFISSVIHAESDFNPHAVSHRGAQGLMQLMPQTASQLGVDNAFDAGANVEGGTRYLRELLERYDYDVVKALAAYNAGPNRVDRYHGVPPYYETQAYIARIIRDFNRKKLAEQKAAKAAHAAASSSRSSSKARVSKPKAGVPGATAAALAAQADRQKEAGSN